MLQNILLDFAEAKDIGISAYLSGETVKSVAGIFLACINFVLPTIGQRIFPLYRCRKLSLFIVSFCAILNYEAKTTTRPSIYTAEEGCINKLSTINRTKCTCILHHNTREWLRKSD